MRFIPRRTKLSNNRVEIEALLCGFVARLCPTISSMTQYSFFNSKSMMVWMTSVCGRLRWFANVKVDCRTPWARRDARVSNLVHSNPSRPRRLKHAYFSP